MRYSEYYCFLDQVLEAVRSTDLTKKKITFEAAYMRTPSREVTDRPGLLDLTGVTEDEVTVITEKNFPRDIPQAGVGWNFVEGVVTFIDICYIRGKLVRKTGGYQTVH